MASEVFMPKLTHDMDAGRLLEWYKQEGDEVQEGEPLFSVETDKAAVDVEAEESGVLNGRRFEPGTEVPVGEVVGWISASGETAHPGTGATHIPAERSPAKLPEGWPPPEGGPPSMGVDRRPDTAAAPSPWAGGRIVATPVARRLAQEHSIDLKQLQGRGPHGRITKADVEAALARRETAPALSTVPDAVPYDVVPLSRLRRTTGERMLTSVRTTPHFDLEVEIDMSEAGRWRARTAEGNGEKVSYTALLVKVVAHALREHPHLNASFVDGELRVYREINIGVATATDDGLMVPVIHGADEMSLSQIQATITRLREKAQASTGTKQVRLRPDQVRFRPHEVRGGTFTVSNLGMYGIDAFRAIINPPEAAILAVGQIVERPTGVDGQIVLRPMMRIVLSVDHQAVDGAQAASFLAAVRRYLENPYLML